MALYSTQNMFNGGELSPLLYGRFDQARYSAGAFCMENALPLLQGGFTKRPGFVFAGTAKTQSKGQNVRLQPFVFNDYDAFMLEFGDKYMRVWQKNGAPLRKVDNSAPYEITTPYTSAHVQSLSIAQSADVLYIAHPDYPPAKISRYALRDWRYSVLSFSPPVVAPTTIYATATGTNPGDGNQTYSYQVCSLDPVSGVLSAPSVARDINASTLSASYHISLSWSSVAGVTDYYIYKKKAGVYGFIGRTSDGACSFLDNNIGPDTGDTPPRIKTPFFGVGNYPSTVFFHQQRLGWASTDKRPLTFWLSQSANFESLAASVPPKDDDAIEATLASSHANRILWVLGDRDALLIGTEGGEYGMQAQGASVLTPTNISFLPQSNVGSVPGVSAIKTGMATLFVRRGGESVQEFGYSYQADKYVPQDLSLLSSHIMKGTGVYSWAFCQRHHSLVWLALGDGTLAALTYLKEHEIIAWSRHQTAGFVEAVASLPGPDGTEDLLWAVINRNGSRNIELLHPLFDGEEKEWAYFVDCGGTYAGEPITSLSGLEHLEGQRVAIFADGSVVPPQTVKNGTITLQNPTSVVHVGLPYSTRVQPTRPEVALQNGQSIMRKRRVTEVYLRVYNTLGFTVTFVQDAYPFGKQEGLRNLASTLVENLPTFETLKDIRVTVAGGWQSEGLLEITSATPTPLTVLAMQSVMEVL